MKTQMNITRNRTKTVLLVLLVAFISTTNIWASNNYSCTHTDTTLVMSFQLDAAFANAYQKPSNATNAVTSLTHIRSTSQSAVIAEAIERDVELSYWMLKPAHESWWDALKEDHEFEMEIEDWMLDISQW
jgi:hypothetical protein